MSVSPAARPQRAAARTPSATASRARPREIPVAEFPRDAHNGFLETAADLGLIGLASLLLVLVTAAAAAVRTAGDGARLHWPVALVAAISLHNLTETSFLQTEGAAGIAWSLFLISSTLLRKRAVAGGPASEP